MLNSKYLFGGIVLASVLLASEVPAACNEGEKKQVAIRALSAANGIEERFGYELEDVASNCADDGKVYLYKHRTEYARARYMVMVIGSEYAADIDAQLDLPGMGQIDIDREPDANPVVSARVGDRTTLSIRYKVFTDYADAQIAVLVFRDR